MCTHVLMCVCTPILRVYGCMLAYVCGCCILYYVVSFLSPFYHLLLFSFSSSFVLSFETRYCHVALADLEQTYVDQVGLKLARIVLLVLPKFLDIQRYSMPGF